MSRIVPSQVTTYIDRAIPENTWPSLGPYNVGALAGLLTLIDKIPDELLAMDNETYSNFILALATIEEQVTFWRYGGPRGSPPELLGSQRGRPLAIVRESLAKCPDEAPAPTTSDLNFITEADFRQSVRNDLGAVERALANGEWKAATVISGSVIEALLLWALQTKRQHAEVDSAIAALTASRGLNQKPDGALDRWELHEYIEVAANLNIIKSQTAAQARLAKDFRNLIHPGRVQRLAQKCDRATAFSAVAGVEHVLRDLS